MASTLGVTPSKLCVLALAQSCTATRARAVALTHLLVSVRDARYSVYNALGNEGLMTFLLVRAIGHTHPTPSVQWSSPATAALRLVERTHK